LTFLTAEDPLLLLRRMRMRLEDEKRSTMQQQMLDGGGKEFRTFWDTLGVVGIARGRRCPTNTCS